MIKQFICHLLGHEKNALYYCDFSGFEYKHPNNLQLNTHTAWLCSRCNKTGISRVRLPKINNEKESKKPKLNIVKFNKHD